MKTTMGAPMRAAVLLAGLIALAPTSRAFAHAHLRSAHPAVDGTTSASVQDIRISYSEGVEPRFCQVTITGPDGHPVEAAKPDVDPTDDKVLIVHLAHALRPGAYKVEWHATAVDTHKTEGTYSFTVAP
jgi:methionine-rich copper-binding protein CopC